MSLRHGMLVTSIALLGAGCGSDPQDVEPTGELVVSILNAATELPLDGVTVQVAGQTRQTAGGIATFDAVTVGTHQLLAARDGFAAASSQVEVAAAERREVSLELTPSAGPPGDGPPADGSLPPPEVLGAYGTFENAVRIEWRPVPGASGYRLYAATSPGVTPQNGTRVGVPPPAPNFSPVYDYPCPEATTCYFVLTAVNATGESGPSMEISGRAAPGLHIHHNISFRGRPIHSQLVFLGDTMGLSVGVQSTLQVVEVSATVAGREFQLSGIPGTAGWTTLLLLEGVPRGPLVLTLTARDASGAVAVSSTRYFLDRQPKVIVIEPLEYSVARPQLPVRVICQDDGPTCSIFVSFFEVYGPYVHPSNQPLDLVIAPTGTGTSLFQARVIDSVLSGHQVELKMEYEPSPRLVEVVSVPGLILDVAADRILWTDSTAGEHRLGIRNRASGADEIIFRSSAPITEAGLLTPRGAIYVRELAPGEPELFERRDGTTLSLGLAQGPEVAGQFAIWESMPGLLRRDLAAGTTQVITGAVPDGGADVAANGDVVYSVNGDIFRWRGGVTTAITNDGTFRVDERPETDGTNVVFQSESPAGAGVQSVTVLNDGSGEIVLAGPFLGPKITSYAVAEGWIAYNKPSTTVDQVWVRTPAGEEVQATALGAASFPETIAPNGRLFFRVSNRGRHFAAPPFTDFDTEVSSGIGRALFIAGQPFITIGRSLFSVN